VVPLVPFYFPSSSWPTPIAKTWKLASIPYRAVIAAIDRIGPLPEVEAVKTIVDQTDDDWLGGGTPPVVTFVKEI
jgi:hypothetical protein